MGKENLGNVVVSETLDGTIFNGTDEEIKNKMLALVTRKGCQRDRSVASA